MVDNSEDEFESVLVSEIFGRRMERSDTLLVDLLTRCGSGGGVMMDNRWRCMFGSNELW